ncbi:hypothetical protein DMC64_20380 [Amycolatopsis sp. WAC 04197]|uniref:LuxR C-terminal-related transcriptional regulator n=1 Tax=Amycolatopsis sp. WAC 04197 TaxID=2203199 RepID=UPI000F7AF299|nr:hypothetical protein DMC64_20380 [Amycolatopsis sp. WAC 04197]
MAGPAHAGLSNKEIAKRVGLTTRTIEFHLSGVHRKLHVSGEESCRRRRSPSPDPDGS